jgi:hypothetical protein
MAVADALRLLWLKGIADARGPRLLGTESFLSKRNTTVNGYDANGGIQLYVSNAKKSAEYFSHEADRFATACFETLLSETTTNTFPRSTAWLIIRMYYSAFFALHSLLRLHGWACSKVGKEVVKSINSELSATFPEAKKLEPGLYLIRSNDSGVEVQLTSMNSLSGGSHEALWSLLSGYVDELLEIAGHEIFEDPVKAGFYSSVEDFKKIVKRNGGAAWFTRMRNNVNYSHQHGAWFPYDGSTSDHARLRRISEYWRLAPDQIPLAEQTDEINQFACACAFLTSLCKTNVEDLRFRSGAKSPFRSSSGRLLLNM